MRRAYPRSPEALCAAKSMAFVSGDDCWPPKVDSFRKGDTKLEQLWGSRYILIIYSLLGFICIHVIHCIHFIRSFIHSFIQSSSQAVSHSIYSFSHPSILLFIHSCHFISFHFINPFIHSSIHPSSHPFIHSFIYLFHSFIHSFHSFIHSFHSFLPFHSFIH